MFRNPKSPKEYFQAPNFTKSCSKDTCRAIPLRRSLYLICPSFKYPIKEKKSIEPKQAKDVR